MKNKLNCSNCGALLEYKIGVAQNYIVDVCKDCIQCIEEHAKIQYEIEAEKLQDVIYDLETELKQVKKARFEL